MTCIHDLPAFMTCTVVCWTGKRGAEQSLSERELGVCSGAGELEKAEGMHRVGSGSPLKLGLSFFSFSFFFFMTSPHSSLCSPVCFVCLVVLLFYPHGAYK